MIPEHADVILDTNVLVHVIRRNLLGERILEDFGLLVRPVAPTISYVTLAELFSLGRQIGWGYSKARADRDNSDESGRRTYRA